MIWTMGGASYLYYNAYDHGSLTCRCGTLLIASSGGKYNPIRTFSSHQILEATNNFDWSYAIGVDRFVWYKGTIENRAVLIKYYKGEPFNFDPDNFYRDIAVSSMMSSHKNVLKLLGCCLEFPRPVLVCEYPEKGALAYIGGAGEVIKPLAWSVRLKIAKEIADAVTYLHTEFPRTIIHRDLKLTNIFLDENWTAKLSSFSLSIPIPEGELGVEDIVCGTQGFGEPHYMVTGFVTENVDIYSFGFIMLSLLTGKHGFYQEPANGDSYNMILLPDYVEKCLGRGPLAKLIDPSMLNSTDDDIPDHSKLQMEAFVNLALRCVGFRSGETKLHMIDVAKELKRIQKQT
ncbi:Protein kinase domain [Arabidopsis thaliana x Arabidopsis arenosa]|jgi:serine/threonine protein kinase|nr:Protein kinase domain [Arabidopsis thaliana x Arabidopsis arenosa]